MTTLTSWKKMVAGYLRVPGCRVQKINILSGWVMLWPHCDGIRRNDGNSKRGHPQGFFFHKTAGHHRTVLALVIIYLWIGFSKNWIIHRFSIDFPLIFLFMDRIFHRFSNSHGKKPSSYWTPQALRSSDHPGITLEPLDPDFFPAAGGTTVDHDATSCSHPARLRYV